VSPVAGQVVERLVAPGEVVPAGFPVLTIIDPEQAYVIVQVREDHLGAVRMGTVLEAVVPALGAERHPFAVTYLSAMADFATWRATNERGDFDLKTFEVRLRPARPVEGLRPGMTVRLHLAPA
jgi:HlyD family secretion protein